MNLANMVAHRPLHLLLMPHVGVWISAISSAIVAISSSAALFKVFLRSEEREIFQADLIHESIKRERDREQQSQNEIFHKKMQRLQAAVERDQASVGAQIPSPKVIEAEQTIPEANQQKIDPLLGDYIKRLDSLNARMTETDAKLDALDKEWENLLDFFRTGGTGCIPIHDSVRSLDLFERAAHPDFNPHCLEHAKSIFSSEESSFDEALFREKGCEYIRPKLRRISLITAVDKNPHRQELATRASINVNVAAKVLCNIAKQKTGHL